MRSSERSRRIAAKRLREKKALQRPGVRTATGIVTRIRARVLRAYRQGHNFVLTARELTKDVTALLREAMVAAHLRGRYRMFLTAQEATGRKIGMAAETPYQDAVRTIQARLHLTDDQIKAIRETYADEAVSVAATKFTPTVEQKLVKAADDIVREGMHIREGMLRIRRAFVEAGAVGRDPALITIAGQRPYLLETLVRTQVQLAYSAGQWHANQDPVIDEIIWGYEYVTVGDDRVRPRHRALDGVKLKKNDPQWKKIWPPNGYSCRCDVIEIFNTDTRLQNVAPPAGRMIVDGDEVVPGADEGWGFNPGLTFQNVLPAAGVRKRGE